MWPLSVSLLQNAGLRCVCAGIAEQQVGLLILNIATNGITPEGMHHVAVMLVRTIVGHNYMYVYICMYSVCVLVCHCMCVR